MRQNTLQWPMLVLTGLLMTSRVAAQPCCSGASAVAPGRLALHEKALIGGLIRGAYMLGSYDGSGQYYGKAPGGTQLDLALDTFASVRLLRRGQMSLLVPVLAAVRGNAAGGEAGGGVGDVSLSGRYDLVWNRQVSYLPGIALLAGLTAPTGRAPEAGQLPLGSDVTGMGAWQFSAGLALERSFGKVLLSGTALVAARTDRTAGGLPSHLAPQLTAIFAASYSFSEKVAVAVIASCLSESDASVSGATVPLTARTQTRLGTAASLSLDDALRLQAGATFEPPLTGFGRNQLSTVALAVTVIRSFL